MSILGVTFNKQTGKWHASLRGYTPTGYIGEFGTEEQATAARQAAELVFHGYVHEQLRATMEAFMRERGFTALRRMLVQLENELARSNRAELATEGWIS